MLHGKGDADDGERLSHADGDVGQGDVPAGEQEPDDVQNESERAATQILAPGQGGARHDVAAERGEGEQPNAPGRSRPRQADDGDRQDRGAQEPGEAGGEPAQDEPQNVEQQGHQRRSLRPASAPTAALAPMPRVYQVKTNGAAVSRQ